MIEDRDLADRLARLAAAVPVRSGQLDPVHAGAVAARQQLRMRWLTPLVALVIGVIAFAIATSGGADPSPAASATPERGSPIGLDRDGDFTLALWADKPLYAPEEPIHIEASLAYIGPQGSIAIHADSTGPIRFSVAEKIFGGIDLGGISLLTCSETTLVRNVPLTQPFKKSGAFDGDHPDAEKFEAFFKDKDLRLPEGTWHITATAGGPCMDTGPAFTVGSQITIVVADDSRATPGV